MRSLFLIVLFLWIAFNPITNFAQNRELAKLELLQEKLKSAKEDTNKVILLQSISYQYNFINPQLGVDFGKQSLELANKLNWKKGKAKSYNSIGGNLFALGDYDKSLEHFNKALNLNKQSKDNIELAKNYSNIGNIYYNLSNYSEALNYYQKALRLDEKIGEKAGIAANLGSIGNIHSELTNYKSALEYYERALKLHEETNDRRGVATLLGNIGLVYHDSKEYKKALSNFNKALELWQLFGNKFGEATNFGNIANTYTDLFEYTKALDYYKKALELNEELGNKFGNAAMLGSIGVLYYRLTQDSIISNLRETNDNIKLIKLKREYHLYKSIVYSEKAVKLAREIGAKDMLMDWLRFLDKANAAKRNFKEAYMYQEQWTEIRDSIYSVEKTKEIAKLESSKQGEINEREIKLRDLEILRKNNEQFVLFVGLSGVAVVLFVIYLQRRKSEKLLLNILPYKIAKRLKRNEKRIADRFEETSIIFIDIVGFTNYSKVTDPVKVVSSLNDIFTKFDTLAKKYGLEKIKTIGDCYMAAAGLPEPHSEHKLATARFAIEAKKMMQGYTTPEGFELLFRIGIDSGPVVAGVIGERKFSYDLWGDAVNTASRMESTGLPNEIQITENFANGLENYGYYCQERGEIEIKGKGTLKTYLLKEEMSPNNEINV